MTTKFFKVGDRVAAYEKGVKQIGKIATIQGESFWIDTGLESTSGVYHFKQCRRLKPNKRREWWISYSNNNGADWAGPSIPPGTSVHVREVRNDSHLAQKAST